MYVRYFRLPEAIWSVPLDVPLYTGLILANCVMCPGI